MTTTDGLVMRDVDTLREAAALMRERAEGATGGPWSEWAVQPVGGETYSAIGNDSTEREVCTIPRDPQGSMDSWHIASWHPAVAVAVADWLEAAARDEEAGVVTAGARDGYPLAVARAYLRAAE